MAEDKNISPLLDGFKLGSPISEHHGVECCPAIKENTNKKYIVKKISVPASQSQFDAMLLAGAYKDPGDAMEYFREKGESILSEAELLKTLSKLEGFLPYDGWQMEPITRRRLGYEVYLVGSYKRSLDKYIRKNAFTHLEAVNLALDLCSALSVCRQSGFLYVDLKPSNIYVSEKKEYRIGDLGFLSLDALRYASLPERYYSPYTPPELLDPMATMNQTVDTYAVGMILYQLYNDGNLPFSGIVPPEELPSPCHADYEMAEIILKAIHPDPVQRWTDPKDLGKAVASYMQRNSVNDIPITPFIPLDVKPEDIVVISTQKQTEEDTPEESGPVAEKPSAVEPDSVNDHDSLTEEDSDAEDQQNVPEESPAPVEIETAPESERATALEEAEDSMIADTAVEDSPTPGLEATVFQPEEDSASDVEVSEEVARIISRADDIIAHEIPEETAFPVPEEQPDPFAFIKEDSEEPDDDLPEDPLMEDEISDKQKTKKKKAKSFENTTRKKKFKKFLSRCLAFLILCGIAIGGFWYYQNIFLQTIDAITVTGTQDQITVLVDTVIEEAVLSVHCIDGNGKRKTEAVQGGKVTFSDLKPSTQYTIEVDMRGFHKLVGDTSQLFTTDATTQVLSFHAIAGAENGSVMLDFTVDGGEPDFWNIRYAADGEEERMETVTGHSATITGLTVGKVYTFTLDGGKNFDLGGETSLQYLASRLILAENLHVTSEDGSVVTIRWDSPGDVVVENWSVRCYDGYGFEEQVTVTENKVLFTGLDPSCNYTVEVTASGMTQPSRIPVSADPIFVSKFHFDEKSATELKVTWDYTGNEPEGGWLLMYTVDGSGSQLLTCEKNATVISPLIPGAKYEFKIQSADTRTIFNNVALYQAEEAKAFTANAFVPENVSADLLRTPEDTAWTCETVGEDAFTNTFSVGDAASVALRSSSALYHPGTKTKVLFVFRDAYGNVLPELVSETTCVWKTIWDAGDPKNGELSVPQLPVATGNYVMELYFDGGLAARFEITMIE